MITKKKLKFYGKILDNIKQVIVENSTFSKTEGIILQKGKILSALEEIILHEFKFLTQDILLEHLHSCNSIPNGEYFLNHYYKRSLLSNKDK